MSLALDSIASNLLGYTSAMFAAAAVGGLAFSRGSDMPPLEQGPTASKPAPSVVARVQRPRNLSNAGPVVGAAFSRPDGERWR